MLLFLPLFILQLLVQALIKKYGQQQAATGPQDHAM
jgi:hypothetical protein